MLWFVVAACMIVQVRVVVHVSAGCLVVVYGACEDIGDTCSGKWVCMYSYEMFKIFCCNNFI